MKCQPIQNVIICVFMCILTTFEGNEKEDLITSLRDVSSWHWC